MYIKPRVIVVDETQYWDARLVEGAGRIFGVYLYDANRRVCCCELTASYELYALEPAIMNYDTCSEADRDEIHEAFGQYTEPVHYVHCYQVDDALTFPQPTQRCKKDDYDEAWEAIVEHYKCNSPYYTVLTPLEVAARQAVELMQELERAGQLVLLVG